MVRKAAKPVRDVSEIPASVGKRDTLDATIRCHEFPDAAGTTYQVDIHVAAIPDTFRVTSRVDRDDREPFDAEKNARDKLDSVLESAGFRLLGKRGKKYIYEKY